MRTRKTLVEGPTTAQHHRVSRPDEARIPVLQVGEYQGTDLVHDSVNKGNVAIIEWMNSDSGQFYQTQAFSYLDLVKEDCSHKIVLYQDIEDNYEPRS